jgi:hypothetical protein
MDRGDEKTGSLAGGKWMIGAKYESTASITKPIELSGLYIRVLIPAIILLTI